MKTAIMIAVVCGYAAAAGAQTQTAAKPAQRAIGEVTAIDAQARKIDIKADSGNPVDVELGEKTLFLRVPPGEKDLTKATRIALTDISVGDRVLARGAMSEDQKSLTATAVIVMSKADLAKKQERDREEWQRRGTAGTVTSIDAATKAITVSIPALTGAKTVTVQPTDKTAYRRYAPDSVKFADARPGTFADIRPGDHVRVLGDKSPDGTTIQAEQIVSGVFRTIAATVKTVDPASGDVTVTDLATRKPLVVHVNSDSSLRKMPPMLAMFMGRRLQAGTGAPGGRPGGPGAGGPAASGPAGPGGPGRSGAGAAPSGERGGFGGMHGGQGGTPDMQQMLERMPAFTLQDLKPGDALVISSTAGTDPARVTAITLVAGVEPLLTAAPEAGARQLGGMWNLGEIPLPQ